VTPAAGTAPAPPVRLPTALSARRCLAAGATGLVAASPLAVVGEPLLVPIAAWIVAATIILGGVWRSVWPQDHAGTKRLAERESLTRTTDTEVLAASCVSLGAVLLALVRSNAQQDAWATVAVISSVVTIALSWCLLNTVFALKYARLYYLDEDGGIDFRQREPPAYSDFAYLAFTVGMSFAVSDTEPTSTAIRKVALGHALLSYTFGTGILAVAVNLVTNL
jgi:uncharacterized membrane protein